MAAENNILDLKEYYDTQTGHNFCRIIRKIISNNWKKPAKEAIIGYGFTLPYLPVLQNDGNKIAAILPSNIGAMNIAEGITPILSEPDTLPLKNEAIDKILIVHGLEQVANPDEIFAEFWRVLKPYGRIMIFSENKILFPEHVISKLRANKFSVSFSRRCVVSANLPVLEIFSGLCGKYYVTEAQKLVFAPRGRAQKITKNILDRLLKPKRKLEPAS
jgi:SAM-dependent methyltransferase